MRGLRQLLKLVISQICTARCNRRSNPDLTADSRGRYAFALTVRTFNLNGGMVDIEFVGKFTCRFCQKTILYLVGITK